MEGELQVKAANFQCGPNRRIEHGTIARRAACLFLVAAWSFGSSSDQALQPSEKVQAMERDLRLAAAWVTAPPQTHLTHNYIVTGSVRLLFFWISRDDVGQGYISLGSTEGQQPTERIKLLMGSDPAKAPLGINRWGAAIEVARPQERDGAFFGFMKTSKGDSASAMRQELSREKEQRQYLFEGIISCRHAGEALSVTVPITSATDFNIHQLDDAEKMVMDRLRVTDRPVRALDIGAFEGCDRSDGFLFTVKGLIEDALSGRTPPFTRCYVYNARRYTMTMTGCEEPTDLSVSVQIRGARGKLKKTYRSIREARFTVLNTESRGRTHFRIKFGTQAPLRGVPVQIEYQPNWWFKATLNLEPEA
jgi:hypothetical protein